MIGSAKPVSPSHWLAALTILVVFAAACGDDGSSADPADRVGSEEADPVTDDAVSGDDVDPGAESADAESDPSAPEPVESSAGEVDVYCRLALENDRASDRFDPTAGPEATEQFVRESQASLAEALLVAPPELRADLATIGEGIDELAEILEANDWDFFAALDAIELLTASPEREAAEDRIDAFEELNCDHPADTSEEDASSDSIEDAFASPEALEALLGSDAGRELLIDGLVESVDLTRDQAACMLDSLDLPALAALAEGADPEADLIADLLAALDSCGISMEDFG